jgi:hypothetical protein
MPVRLPQFSFEKRFAVSDSIAGPGILR